MGFTSSEKPKPIEALKPLEIEKLDSPKLLSAADNSMNKTKSQDFKSRLTIPSLGKSLGEIGLGKI